MCAQAPLKQEDHFLYAAVYSVKGEQSSTLVLNNTTHHEETARVTLFNKDGRSYAIPEVTLAANLNKRIELADLIAHHGLDGFEEGSVEIFFHDVGMGIGGQLVIYDYPHSLSFDVPFTEMMSFNSSQVESLWWGLNNQMQAQVYIANTESVQTIVTPTYYVGGNTITRDAIALDAHHQELINIGKELKRLKVKGDTGVGGIALQYSNGPGAIAVAGAITSKQTGFSSTMRFSDTTMYRTATLYGAYLPIGQPTTESRLSSNLRFIPHVTVGNVTDASVQVKTIIHYLVDKDGRSLELAPVTLAGHEVRELDVSPVLSAVSGKVLSDSGIEIAQSGPLGAIIGAVASVDQSGNQVFDVPLRDPKLLNMTAGGNHPWIIAGNNQAVLHLKNIDPDTNTTRRQAVVKLFFEGGSYSLPLQLINAGQTLSVDIKKLRNEQVKDSFGNVIPRNVTTGQVQWFSRGAVGQFVGRLVQYDPEAKIASSFSCGTICACDPGLNNAGSYVTLSSSTGYVGGTFDIQVFEEYDVCSGDAPSEVDASFVDVTSEADISSSNPAIASVDGTSGQFESTSGTAQISAFWPSSTNPGCLQGDVGGVCDSLDCPNDSAEGEASTNAQTIHIQLKLTVPAQAVPLDNSDTSASIIAGQELGVTLEAVDDNGHVPCVNVAITSSGSRTLDSSETGFPSTFNLSCGTYGRNVLLNRVNNTDRGTTFRLTLGAGSQDFFFYTYFSVVASREGLVGGTTACGHTITSNDHFVALPATNLCDVGVIVVGSSSNTTTTVRDVGPWFPHGSATTGNPCVGSNDTYWNTGGVPRVANETCDSDNAGIDLADGTAADVGVSGLGNVVWRFQ